MPKNGRTPTQYPIANPEEIYLAAESFYKTSIMVSRLRQQKQSAANYDFLYALMGTEVANNALSLELFFKCIHSIENGFYLGGHRLLSQFEYLSQNAKTKIESYYDECMGQNPQVLQSKSLGQNIGPIDLTSVLIEADSAFIDFRYVFEQNIQSYKGTVVARATRCYLLELNSHWAQLEL